MLLALLTACRHAPAELDWGPGQLRLVSGRRWVLGEPSLLAELGGSGTLAAVACGDLDGDGLRDLVTSDRGGVRLLSGAALLSGAPAPPPVGEPNTSLWCAPDLDGDGVPDLTLVRGAAPGRSLAEGRWERLPAPPGPAGAGSANGPCGGGRWPVPSADVDGDGGGDVLARTFGREPALAGFAAGADPCVDTPRWTLPGDASEAVPVDLDGDGHPELVTAGSDRGDWLVRAWPAPSGAAAFARRDALAALRAERPVLVRVLDDLDGDGVRDLAWFAWDMSAVTQILR